MATDWLLYFMLKPLGLLAIGVAILVPFVFWRLVLGKEFPSIGFWPLSAGYFCMAVGLLVLFFGDSYLEFSSRVEKGVLEESERWSHVVGWTFYMGMISLVFVLPLIGIIGVPLAAFMLKKNWLSYLHIGWVLLACWIILSFLGWILPQNEWHQTHPLDSFIIWLLDTAPGVALIGGPFLLGIYGAATRRGYRSWWVPRR